MKRAGVSPVIATLLLIVIAVAAAVLAYIWIIGYQGTLTQQASTAQLQERIRIETVNYTGSQLKVWVRNIGDVKVTITAGYIINATGLTIAADTTLSKSLNLGQVDYVTIPQTGTVTLKPGITYTVKVVTSKGTETTYTFTYRE
jgi:flagellin-like protein